MTATLEPPKLRRRATDRLFGGVAGGIADHLRISATSVRAAFVVLSFAGGLGVVVYSVFWIVLPSDPGVDGVAGMSAGEYVVAGLAALVALTSSIWTAPFGSLFIPAAMACVGAALLWRQAGNGERARWRQLSHASLTAPADARQGRARLVIGAGLVLVGCVLVLAKADVSAVRDGLVAVAVTVVGLALVTGPWWVRMVSELADERRERIRSQERADLAASLHDSVLQTLALIQRNAASPREVARLARSQERELRTLLYGEGDPSGQLSDAVRAAAAEVEDAYAVSVDVVVVGDVALDETAAALVGAAREAMVNAAKHAGVDEISVYLEVEQEAVVVYVRDRGAGFDPDAVPAHRHGVEGSIVGRVERHGGQASIRSSAGAGTEVTIRMPR